VNAESFGYITEPLVLRPQHGRRIDEDGSNQVRIGQADALAIQGASLNHLPHFAWLRHPRPWQQVRRGESLSPIPEPSQGQFPNDDRAHHNAPAGKLPAYKAKGKTVNVKLTPETTPVYWAASQEYRKLKLLLNRLERLSETVLRHQAKMTQSTPATDRKTGDIFISRLSAPIRSRLL